MAGSCAQGAHYTRGCGRMNISFPTVPGRRVIHGRLRKLLGHFMGLLCSNWSSLSFAHSPSAVVTACSVITVYQRQ
ncbi:hypothetical protein K491DRAFT_315332 [Lophiostoma macrostomum CBS 122681]|uniref:Uncharacterized protein n=1 Tax=Lophiostoma macrostomum CBS 122681 TaxID=1314788 RepID=A0A6A6TD10_9PLEO|nr:hypothetical protein K491DRAFT_315332 [Lophiostoma macrostomum CBS 122681]